MRLACSMVNSGTQAGSNLRMGQQFACTCLSLIAGTDGSSDGLVDFLVERLEHLDVCIAVLRRNTNVSGEDVLQARPPGRQ